jgi:hypothetical protein
MILQFTRGCFICLIIKTITQQILRSAVTARRFHRALVCVVFVRCIRISKQNACPANVARQPLFGNRCPATITKPLANAKGFKKWLGNQDAVAGFSSVAFLTQRRPFNKSSLPSSTPCFISTRSTKSGATRLNGGGSLFRAVRARTALSPISTPRPAGPSGPAVIRSFK